MGLATLSGTVRRQMPSRLRATGEVLFLAAVLMGLLLVTVRLHCGSWELVVPYLRGERLIVLDREIDLGEQPPGAVVERSIRVVNLTDSDVRILGAQRSCNCMALDAFPLSMAVGSERAFRVRMAVPLDEGMYSHTIKFFTDWASRPWFVVTVRGRVSVASAEPLKPIPDDGPGGGRDKRDAL